MKKIIVLIFLTAIISFTQEKDSVVTKEKLQEEFTILLKREAEVQSQMYLLNEELKAIRERKAVIKKLYTELAK